MKKIHISALPTTIWLKFGCEVSDVCRYLSCKSSSKSVEQSAVFCSLIWGSQHFKNILFLPISDSIQPDFGDIDSFFIGGCCN